MKTAFYLFRPFSIQISKYLSVDTELRHDLSVVWVVVETDGGAQVDLLTIGHALQGAQASQANSAASKKFATIQLAIAIVKEATSAIVGPVGTIVELTGLVVKPAGVIVEPAGVVIEPARMTTVEVIVVKSAGMIVETIVESTIIESTIVMESTIVETIATKTATTAKKTSTGATEKSTNESRVGLLGRLGRVGHLLLLIFSTATSKLPVPPAFSAAFFVVFAAVVRI